MTNTYLKFGIQDSKSLIFISEGSHDSSSSGISRNSEGSTIRVIPDQVQPPVQTLAHQVQAQSGPLVPAATIKLVEYNQISY